MKFGVYICAGFLFAFQAFGKPVAELRLNSGVHTNSYGVERTDPVFSIHLYVDPVATLLAGTTELDDIADDNHAYLSGGTIYASSIDASNFTWSAGSLHLTGGSHTTTYGSFDNVSDKAFYVHSGASVDQSSSLGLGTFGNRNRITVQDGGVFNAASYLEIGHSGSDNQLLVSSGGRFSAGSVVAIGGGGSDSWYNSVTVTGAGSKLSASALIIGPEAYASSLQIKDGGEVNTSNVYIPGLETFGTPRASFVDVSGTNSSLNISNAFIIGGSGVQNYAEISRGGRISAAKGVTIIPGNGLLLLDEGRLEVGTNFNASMTGFFFYGGTLSVAGTVTGLPVLENGLRLETPHVQGDLEVHGVFAPGRSPANSVVEGGLTLAADGMLEMELGGYTQGSEYDHLSISGSNVLAGNLSLVFLDGFVPTNGASFNLFDWIVPTGTFSSISELSGGLSWNKTELYTHGVLSVIPEPASLSLMGLSSSVAFIVRSIRRRRRMGKSLLPIEREYAMDAFFEGDDDSEEGHPLINWMTRSVLPACAEQKEQLARRIKVKADRLWDALIAWDGRKAEWYRQVQARVGAIRPRLIRALDEVLARIMK